MSELLQETTEMSTSINEIADALAKAQAELAGASKDNSGYGYNYSDLASVINSSRPALTKNGLAVVQLVGKTTDESVSVTTILAHKSGQFFKTVGTLPIVDMKGCNAAQSAGASLSYLKRYQYQSIIGQPSEDNDASSEGFKKNAPSFPAKNVATTAAKTVETKAVETKVDDKAAATSAVKRGGFKIKSTGGTSNANSEL
jgi:hypothetical protein